MIDVGRVLAWPLVALVALVVLRKPVGAMLSDVGKRATKLSLFQFAVELATVPELAPQWNVPNAGDVRQLTRADVFDSYTTTLFQQLAIAGASDYITVDLGAGDQWLTSRLYIFVVMLRRLRGLRCVVFTATVRDVRGAFIGWAEATEARWMLAMLYPWFESALAHALAAVNPAVMSLNGGMQFYEANNVVKEFLHNIQANDQGMAGLGSGAQPGAPPPAGVPGPPEWIRLPLAQGEVQVWEHAAWITPTLMDGLIGPNDADAAFVDSPDTGADARAKAIARRSGPFVALVNPAGRFKALVDRQALLESMAATYAES